MLTDLKFVQGAVSKKDLVPTMKHFQIKDGLITAYNGELALSTPISINLECNPLAGQMIKAISQCSDQISLSLNDAGNLRIVSENFRVVVPCHPEPFVDVKPEGEQMEIDGEALLKGLKVLQPFISTDASRPWTMGVLFNNHSAFATNNVCLVEYWIGCTFPMRVNIPSSAISEIVRINEPPEKLMVAENNLSVLYSGGRWLRTQLLACDWPDVSQLLSDDAQVVPISENLFPALDKIKPFLDTMSRVFLENGEVRTDQNEDNGAVVKIDNFDYECVFVHDKLALLKGVATHIDFSQFPKPCPFVGDNLRGVIIGLRL